MTKKGRGQILGLILQQLNDKSMTASELADSISSNWDTVKNNLEILEELGLCKGTTEGKKKTVYKLEQIKYQTDGRTWFGLPITEDQKLITEKYLGSAKEAWIRFTDIKPNRTQIEKTVFEMVQIQKEKNVPIGMYLYGPVALLHPDQSSYSGFDDHLVESAKDIVNHLKTFKYSKSMIFELYKRYDMKAHKNKIEFEEALMRGVDEDSKVQLIITLNNILRSYSIDKCIFDKVIVSVQEILDEYISVISKLILSNKPDYINKELREPIIDSFSKLWTLLARIMFLEDMKKYIPTDIIKCSLARSFVDILKDVELSIDMLFEFIPKKEVKPNPSFAKFVGIAKN
ncbi:MAG: winged helix-turn-helix domain-containing protein [archaeon]